MVIKVGAFRGAGIKNAPKRNSRPLLKHLTHKRLTIRRTFKGEHYEI